MSELAGSGKLRRLDSAAPYKSAMDRFFETNLEASREFSSTMDMEAMLAQAVDAAGGASGEVDVAKLKDFQISVAASSVAFMQDKQKENILALWDEYDKDKSGDLSTDEIAMLLEDHLLVQKKNMTSTIDNSLEVAKEQGIAPAKLFTKMQFMSLIRQRKPNATEAEHEAIVDKLLPSDDQLREQIRSSMEKLKPQFIEVVARSFEQIETNMDEVCRNMVEEMDVNHDGRIDREEFQEHILQAMAHIVDIGKLLQTVAAPGAADV